MNTKEKWALTLLLSAVPFLTACSSFTGFASERYDGVKINGDEAAIRAYKENREIIGAEKEGYQTDALFQFLTQPPLDFATEETYLGLTKYRNVVGKDLLEGRYTVLYEGYSSPDTIIVRDESGEVLYQKMLSYAANTFELDLFNGQTIEGSTDAIASNIITNEPIAAPPASEGISLPNGVWHASTHIPAGEYEVHVPNSFSQYIPHLYVVSGDQEMRLYELLSLAPGEEEFTFSLTVEDGDVLLLEDSLPLIFTPIKE